MAKKFGTTWWGEQWLNSLNNIDYGNRLPRGASYARRRAVLGIKITGGKITARVAGSRPTPYRVTIDVPPFDPENAAKFVDTLAVQPVIVASLMQRKFDPEVLQIARDNGLQVFPSSWKDLSMKCSCPDWAVPCKHLAAVIYKVSEEIDNDPFLVFSLHGLDLLGEFKKRGMIAADADRNLDPIGIDEFLHSAALESKPAVTAPDFSKLPDIGDELLELLADNPPFSIDGDFKKVYVRQLAKIGKSVAKLLDAVGAGSSDLTAGSGDMADEFIGGRDVRFRINASYETEVTLFAPGKKSRQLTFGEFTDLLAMLSPASLLTGQPWMEPLYRMWLFAANLISRRDVVPQIVSLGKEFKIFWQPAMVHPYIRGVADAVTSGVSVPVTTRDGSEIANPGAWLLCNMLNALIASCGDERLAIDQLYGLFFRDYTEAFGRTGQGGYAGGIRMWTDKFFMLRDGCEFELQADEAGSLFEVTVFVRPDAGDPSVRMSLADFMHDPAVKQQQLAVITKLSSLIDYMPELRGYVNNRGCEPMTFDARSFVPFLFKTLPLMRLLGIGIALPKSLRELVKPKVAVRIDCKDSGDSGKSYIRIDELLDFSWEVALGDTLLTTEEFSSLMLHAGELVKFKGQYVYASAEELDRISRQLAAGGKLKPLEMLAAALSGSYGDAPVVVTDACRELLDRFRQLSPLSVPEGLQADLRPYQQRGYEWMMHNLSLGFGAIIADDMGLGKTLQVITVLLQFKASGRLDSRKALVVVPTGLLTNWKSECARFAPALEVMIYHGPSRDLAAFDADVLLTSYGVVRSDAALLKKRKWEIIVIDEAQNIKNTATAQTKAVNSINAAARIAMSGTPVENRLSEYWSIMNFVNKGLLGSLREFNKQFTRPIQFEGSQEAASRFKAMTSPFTLRRLKSDKSIISDLPDKIERDEYASLTPEQSALYQQTLEEAMHEIEGVNGTDHASLFRREGLVLQMILALKQICNHPSQFLKSPNAATEQSGKAMMLVDLVQTIVNSGEKVLVFTQFREMGDIIVRLLEQTGIASMFYHGGCSLKKREEMVERFQNLRSEQVFVLSLKAAGTGLNLTAATNVIHFDLWWNPAVEAQATDRAYRIGQHSNVQVYRFITQGTFEEKINAMIQDKKQLADMTVSTGEKWLAKMSDTELRSVFTLAPEA